MVEEVKIDEEGTGVGNHFISNYPPYAYWSAELVPEARRMLDELPTDDRPLGMYVHIPFCRKRCDFCYFKVYTDKNSSEIRRYLDAVVRELATYADRPYIAGRKPQFVYFGGGTPSYLSADQMRGLFSELKSALDWSDVREVTYECEPGTLSLAKVEALREVGVTRLSLGVENFDPDILELNNRAHRAEEIHRTYGFARDVGFPSINVDLIAGMVGENDANWQACIEKTLELDPESVTVYQMEVPYNTTLYKRMKDGGQEVAPVASWETKRRWTTEIFERLKAAGYRQSSAYTACRGDETSFVYRDALWHGADMLGLGLSSFGQLGGRHYQNEPNFDAYVASIEAGQSPVTRAYALDDEERMIREFILQLKLGELDVAYFQEKFGVDVLSRFAGPFEEHRSSGYLTFDAEKVRTTPEGLMLVDRLLPAFFLEHHCGARYV
jgi:oxygen-independent coproporphyrinogen-3 oxidase